MNNPLHKLATLTLASVASVTQVYGETQNMTTLFDATALAHTCLNCHSSRANGTNDERLSIPRIFDRDTETIYQQLVAFQQDTLPPNTTIMNQLVAAFNDSELKAIAEAVGKINVEEY